MIHTDPNGVMYITRNVMFNSIEHYVKEIHLIVRESDPIKMITQLQPVQPIQMKTKLAPRPESIRFVGNYEEDWDLSLN